MLYFSKDLIMHQVISEQYVNPITDCYNYWVKKSLLEGLDILMSNKQNVTIDSKDEIIDRIWKVIPWVFDQGQLTAKRYVIDLFTYVFLCLI